MTVIPSRTFLKTRLFVRLKGRRRVVLLSVKTLLTFRLLMSAIKIKFPSFRLKVWRPASSFHAVLFSRVIITFIRYLRTPVVILTFVHVSLTMVNMMVPPRWW